MTEHSEAYYNAYRTAKETVGKTRQIVMLYEGAITYIRQAKEAIQAKDVEGRYNLIQKAADIIHGMQDSLDFDNGGEIAPLLYDYYQDIYVDLMAVHDTERLDLCDRAIGQLENMLESWRKIDEDYADKPKQAKRAEDSTAGEESGNKPGGGVEISA